LIVVLLLPVSTTSWALDLSSQYRALYSSVVTLVTEGTTVDRERDELTAAEGLGSGVLIDKDGLILTASHVVQVADAVGVVFADGQSVPATVVSSLPQADLALVRAESVPEGVRPVKLADSSRIEAGNEIFVIGAPFGLHSTITSGIVSARYQPGSNPRFWLAEMIQIDAAVNKGSSGGPVFDAKGRCIGIVSHLKTLSGGFEGHGFAVTTNTARERLIGKPGVWSGLSGKVLGEEMAWIFNLPEASGGFLVEKVAAGSLGDRLGLIAGTVPATIRKRKYLLGGDVIMRVNDIPVAKLKDHYDELVSSLKPGDTMTLAIMRGGAVMELTGKLQ
jgi:S1-C subfamily serine protease